MLLLKQRIYALILTLVSAGVLYSTWYDAQHSGSYYLKAAAFAPVGIIDGIFLMIFPQFGGKPETGRAKVIVLSIFAVGLLAGLYNWYLIDPSNFSFSAP